MEYLVFIIGLIFNLLKLAVVMATIYVAIPKKNAREKPSTTHYFTNFKEGTYYNLRILV